MRKLQNTKQEEEMNANVKEEEGTRGAVRVRARWRYRKTAKQMICFVVCAKNANEIGHWQKWERVRASKSERETEIDRDASETPGV